MPAPASEPNREKNDMATLSSAPTANRADERPISPPSEFWRVSPDMYAMRPEMAQAAGRGANILEAISKILKGAIMALL